LVRTEDLIQYGFESEFVGRLPIIARLKELGVEGLYQILKNARSSVISSKKRDFKAYGIELEFEDEALREIAIRADKEKTGARGLVSVMEKALTTFEKKFPSTNIKHLLVTKDLVENPQQHLKKMVFDDIITSFQRDFLLDNGLVLEFTPKAKKQLEEKYYDGENLQDFLRDNFKDYSYGLKLIGAENFKINSEVLQDPIQYLNVLIKKSYSKDKKL
jgi:hypothetical protein